MAQNKAKNMPRKQQSAVMIKVKNAGSKAKSAGSRVTSRMKPRKTKPIDDSIKRQSNEIKEEKNKRTDLNKKLAIAHDPKKRKQIKMGIKGKHKKIKRKKRELSETKRKRREIKYVMNKLHTKDYSEAETLLDYANNRDVEYNEVDWGEMQGADLSTEVKKEMLKEQLEQDYSRY